MEKYTQAKYTMGEKFTQKMWTPNPNVKVGMGAEETLEKGGFHHCHK